MVFNFGNYVACPNDYSFYARWIEKKDLPAEMKKCNKDGIYQYEVNLHFSSGRIEKYHAFGSDDAWKMYLNRCKGNVFDMSDLIVSEVEG